MQRPYALGEGGGETGFPHPSADAGRRPAHPGPAPGRVWEGCALPRRMFIPSVRGGAAWTADMMVFEKFIRYAGLAVGLKPSATGCEARLRGLYRIIFSKTIIEAAHLRACGAAAPLLTSPR